MLCLFLNIRLDRAWLFGLGLFAACGPLPPQTSDTADDGTTGDDTATTSATTGTTSTTATTGPETSATTGTTDPPDPPECGSSLDCGYCSYCDDGQCVPEADCCDDYVTPDGLHEWRCQPPPECYVDADCPTDHVCDQIFCLPIQQMVLPPCEFPPVQLSDWQLTGAPSGLGLADLDGDGDLDLFAALPAAAAIELAFNDGAGNFAAGEVVDAGPPVDALHAAAGDLDGDGVLDLAAARSADAEVRLLLQQNGKFVPGPQLSSGAPNHTIAALDVEGDGDLDLASIIGGHDGVALWTNDGQWTAQISAGAFPGATAVQHVTADAVVDLVRVAQQKVDVFAGLVPADAQQLVFSLGVPEGWSQARAVQLGGGGNEVLAFGSVEPRLRVWRNVAGDVWDPVPTDFITTTMLRDGRDGDFNGDGAADLIVATGDTTLAVLAGNGADGLACELQIPVPLFTNPTLLAVGDLTGDGHADVVLGASDATALVVVRAP